MLCDIALALIETYSKAAVEHFEAAEKMAELVGKHCEFMEAKAIAEDKRVECRTARLALKKHWAEHGCRSNWVRISN